MPSTTEKIPPGTVVRVADDSAKDWDVPKGSEWVVERWMADDSDHPVDPTPAGYLLEPLPGSGRIGDWFAPEGCLEIVHSAEQQAEFMKMPSLEEIVEIVQDGLMSSFGSSGFEVYESEREHGTDPGPWESPNDFSHGVTFYARRPGGRSFGATLRITGLWPTDY